jgi:hypothetical protein
MSENRLTDNTPRTTQTPHTHQPTSHALTPILPRQGVDWACCRTDKSALHTPTPIHALSGSKKQGQQGQGGQQGQREQREDGMCGQKVRPVTGGDGRHPQVWSPPMAERHQGQTPAPNTAAAQAKRGTASDPAGSTAHTHKGAWTSSRGTAHQATQHPKQNCTSQPPPAQQRTTPLPQLGAHDANAPTTLVLTRPSPLAQGQCAPPRAVRSEPEASTVTFAAENRTFAETRNLIIDPRLRLAPQTLIHIPAKTLKRPRPVTLNPPEKTKDATTPNTIPANILDCPPQTQHPLQDAHPIHTTPAAHTNDTDPNPTHTDGPTLTTGNQRGHGYLYNPNTRSPPLYLDTSTWLPQEQQGHRVIRRGLFTRDTIPYVRGATRKPITLYAGRIIPHPGMQTAEQASYIRSINRYLKVDGFREPTEGYGMAQFCNDPSRPGLHGHMTQDPDRENCELKVDDRTNTITLLPKPKRNIAAGEELCYRYGTLGHYWQRHTDDNLELLEQHPTPAPKDKPVIMPTHIPTPPEPNTTHLAISHTKEPTPDTPEHRPPGNTPPTRRSSGRKRQAPIRFTPGLDPPNPLDPAPQNPRRLTKPRAAIHPDTLRHLLGPTTQPPSYTSYLTIKRSSIHALPRQKDRGVWTNTHIPRHGVLGTYEGDTLSYTEYHTRYPNDDCEYAFPTGPCNAHATDQSCPHKATCEWIHQYLDATDAVSTSKMRYMNDCGGDPSHANVEITMANGTVTYSALRPCVPGEELFCDYGSNFPWTGTNPRHPPPPALRHRLRHRRSQ